MCKLSVHIQCTRDNPGAVLMYDIDTDDGQWVVVGKNTGMCGPCRGRGVRKGYG